MRVVNFNVNGVRAATAKGLAGWLAATGADVICLQELRATSEQLPSEIVELAGYRAYWHCAERKGYSGVALLSRAEPDQVICGIDHPDFRAEGRVVRADYAELSILSLYVPSGITGPDRQAQKMVFLDFLLEHLSALKTGGRELIVGGDFNIAHRPIDLYHPTRHATTSGYLPEERAWMDALLARDFVDVFRKLVGPETGHYSWWSNFRKARERNLGWRLDYQIATPGIAARAASARIEREVVLSDHAPLSVEYEHLLPSRAGGTPPPTPARPPGQLSFKLS